MDLGEVLSQHKVMKIAEAACVLPVHS